MNEYFELEILAKTIKRLSSSDMILSVTINFKVDWLNAIPHWHDKNVSKETKSEKNFVIFLTWNSDWSWVWPKKQKGLKKQLGISKEKHCCHDGLPLPKKRLSYEKCFVLPVVDLKLNSSFEVLIMILGLNAIRNRIHLKLLCKLCFLLGSLPLLLLKHGHWST